VYKVLFLVVVAVLMVGCASNEEKALVETFKKELSYSKNLLKTEKAQFLDENNITKVLLTATYLYAISSEKIDKRDEEFVIGLQFEDENTSFESSDFTLKLDNNESKNLVKLEVEDERLKGISFVSKWGEYYLLTFKHTEKTKFNLVFESETYGMRTLHFAKKAKYVYTKTGF
jgi:hypothetical protein